MSKERFDFENNQFEFLSHLLVVVLIFVVAFPFNIFSATPDNKPIEPRGAHPYQRTQAKVPDTKPSAQAMKAFPDTMVISHPEGEQVEVVGDSIVTVGDSTMLIPVGAVPVDTLVAKADTVAKKPDFDPDYVVRDFNPDPTRAVWLSALCPGLGQLYNRRYWKLPIVIGAFMGLGYATDWNNRMLSDYTQGYRDLLDNDPSTKSYMNFYPPNTKEENLDKTWLQKTFKSRKDFYRRNRDLCIISMVGVYLLAMVDAYVDASLAHFDISPDLSMEVYPAVIKDTHSARPGLGVQWAINF
jgi:hypothetical protein